MLFLAISARQILTFRFVAPEKKCLFYMSIILNSKRSLRALGYGVPAEQSTGANEVSEADERVAKDGTADLNKVKGTPLQKKSVIQQKILKTHLFRLLFLPFGI